MLSHEPGFEINELQGILSAVRKNAGKYNGVSRIEPLALPLISEESLTEQSASKSGFEG